MLATTATTASPLRFDHREDFPADLELRGHNKYNTVAKISTVIIRSNGKNGMRKPKEMLRPMSVKGIAVQTGQSNASPPKTVLTPVARRTPEGQLPFRLCHAKSPALKAMKRTMSVVKRSSSVFTGTRTGPGSSGDSRSISHAKNSAVMPPVNIKAIQKMPDVRTRFIRFSNVPDIAWGLQTLSPRNARARWYRSP